MVGTQQLRSDVRRPASASVRRRVVALGALTLCMAFGALVIGATLLSQSRAIRLGEARRQLSRVANLLAPRYEDLLRTFALQGHPGDAEFGSVTQAALADVQGVEGGAWLEDGGRLLGYAYPTYLGTGPKTDVPSAERTTIEASAREAFGLGRDVSRQITVGSETILFQARPLVVDGRPVGAVWLMHRVIGGPRRWFYQLGVGVLLVAAALGAGSAFILTRRIEGGIGQIERSLAAMEKKLDVDVPALGLVELDRIGAAIEQLGRALAQDRERRAALEQRLREADRLAALGTLVAGVAHEVRNPLASMKLKLQLSRQKLAATPELEDTVSVVEAECARLDRLVQRLLLLGRSSAPDPRPTDVLAFAKERVALWTSRAAERGARLTIGPTRDLAGPIALDRDPVRQILDNLLSNGIEAVAERGGEVHVELSRENSTLTVAVSDNGPGLAPEARAHLFQPFFTTRDGGTGLGLFISAELARRLGGELRYRAPEAGGTRFEVRLPC